MKFLICVVLTVAAASVEAGMGHGKALKCKGEDFNMKPLMKHGADCFKEVFGKDAKWTPGKNVTESEKKAFMEKLPCLMLCKTKKAGVIDDKGKYSSESAAKVVKEMFPASVQSEMVKAFDQCAKDNDKTFTTDNKCADFAKFETCKRKKAMEICKWDKKSASESSEDI